MTRGSYTALLGVLIALGPGCEESAEPPMIPQQAAHLAPPEPGDGRDEIADAGSDAFTMGPQAAPNPGALQAPSPATDPFPGELGSIAMETSIYEEPRWNARRLGYLRAGAVVKRGAAPVATGPRCPEGWYRIEPRGFVCVGAYATLDANHPVIAASSRRPRLDDLPYHYAISRVPGPPLYARLPARAEQRRFERDLDEHLERAGVVPANLPPLDPIPDWLQPGRPSLSLGNDWHAPNRVLLGRARPRSGYALTSLFAYEGRHFGVTTGLEIVPLDWTRLVKPSSFSGVALGSEVTLPIAFVRRPAAFRILEGASGFTGGGALRYREAVAITEATREVNGVEYVVARDGALIRADQVVIVKPYKNPPAWAREGVKWIDVSIPRQVLVAYEGLVPVYATLVSTGKGGTGDPKETHATIQGAFKIYEKHISVTMDGNESSDAFDLHDVPFVQYFSGGYALHAAYWHDDFGRMRSHGCVNLAPVDAAWLFRWTDPRVPAGWHGALSGSGTIVYVHG